mmetsp:Transcript_35715/g.87917  ORF Transcript_35715/g.87917 Transcript_35715/m.87917 type:complete len:230 (-) Transcript_35715:110-799(-)
MDGGERQLILDAVAELLMVGHQLALVIELVRAVEQDARLQLGGGAAQRLLLRLLVAPHVEQARGREGVVGGVEVAAHAQQVSVRAVALLVLAVVEVRVRQPLQVGDVAGVALALELQQRDGANVVALGQKLRELRNLHSVGPRPASLGLLGHPRRALGAGLAHHGCRWWVVGCGGVTPARANRKGPSGHTNTRRQHGVIKRGRKSGQHGLTFHRWRCCWLFGLFFAFSK